MPTQFRPCIDLHQGKVKQIVGGTLNSESLHTNFVSNKPSSYFAKLYKENDLEGGHIIMLGAGNEKAAVEALSEWPGNLQIGGGINLDNAKVWLDEHKASKVIVTSYLFTNKVLDLQKLKDISNLVGKQRLVVDLSCRKVGEGWNVAIDKWQTITNFQISKDNLIKLSEYCSEFLIHAADKEGLQQGVDTKLIEVLGAWSPIPVTYAGGAKAIDDFELVKRLSKGKVDLTFGSALDIFGGSLKFEDCVKWSNKNKV